LDTFGPVEAEQVDIQVLVVTVGEVVGYMRLDQVTEAVEVEDQYLQVKVAPVEEWAFMVRAVTVAEVLTIVLQTVYKVAVARVAEAVEMLHSQLQLLE